MSTINGTSNTSNVFENLNKARDNKSDAEETQDRFLKLLMTQLQNQDPMNPMDSAQSTSQMAQINMVTGIDNLNASITSMMSTFNAGQSFQAAGLIGKQVLVSGDTMRYSGSGAVQSEIEVPEGGGLITVSIYNDSGQKIDEIALGQQKAGRQAVEWDGKNSAGNAMPAGKYYLDASMNLPDGGTKQISSFTFVDVDSVAIANGGVNVKLVDGRSVAFSDVTQIK
ncbi:flagellar hook assembly protein FlgD [Chitinimonas koreensis]|uniref:flagellar hook assembly protein FlgD n=1 Tax=Chitinimonas koreensis TaxID=356302 RepID=UPI0004100952|nr:flagellar hook assembly protein FlgD [Chitinimonas koreensis]QNM98464.1 flagellar hook assembly protein FlgD [Chitinimonas koreensis]